MEELLSILGETQIPLPMTILQKANRGPALICYLPPGSNNFADGKVYYKISQVNIELYTDRKDPAVEQKLEDALDVASIFITKPKYGLTAGCMKSFINLKWRFNYA